MPSENVAIVRRAYEAWNAGAPVVELLDADVEWWMPPNFPDADFWRGREAIVAGRMFNGTSGALAAVDLKQ